MYFDRTTPISVRRKRLIELADFIEKLPPEKLTMEQWGNPQTATVTSCGTSGCVAGWAATKFHDKGFQLKVNAFNVCGQTIKVAYPILYLKDAIVYDEDAPKDDQEVMPEDEEAFAEFFGIPKSYATAIVFGHEKALKKDFSKEKHPCELAGYYSVYGVEGNDITPAIVQARIRTVLSALEEQERKDKNIFARIWNYLRGL